jgi:hypothetical protein
MAEDFRGCMKLCVRISSGLLLIAVSSKAKEPSRTVAMSLFYSLQKDYLKKIILMFEHLLSCIIS